MRETFPIGVNIFVVRNDKLLLGKRKNTYGAGTWGLPGGHLEFGERLEAAAARELKEETGIKTEKFIFVNLINDLHDLRGEQKHYLQVGFLAKDIGDAEPILNEPDKTEEWKWFGLADLPKDIFPSHIEQIEAFQKKKYFL
jgi:8-oxo-dGTP diphosphatase